MPASIVDSASLSPGTCLISGDFNGPFVDTGRSVPRIGRIYIAVKALAPLMRELGYVHRDEVEAELELVAEAQATAEQMQDKARRYDDITTALEPLLPTPPETVKEVGVVLDRKLQAEVDKLRAQVDSLKSDLRDAKAAAATAASQTAVPPSREGSAGGEAPSITLPDPWVTVFGQSVDVTELLKLNAPEIVDIISDWPFEVLQIVVAYEKAGKARKSVLAALPEV